MPTYQHEGVVVNFPDQAVGISASGLLANMGTFHVKLTPGSRGELFSLRSPGYQIALVVEETSVSFRRNAYVARKEIGAVRRHFQVLVSWRPEQFHLALMIDDDVGGDEACVTIHTAAMFVPLDLISWARRFNLLPRSTYNSAPEFLGVFVESLRQANRTIRDTKAFHLFWDRQRDKGSQLHLVPKREPEAMAGIAGYLHDQSLLAGYQLIQESQAGSGTLDLRALATLTKGGFVNVCVEGKNAHSPDLAHGIRDQLPAYMQSVNADYGVYLVLWHRCEAFPEPSGENIDVTLPLTRLRPWETIVIETFDLSIPGSPSSRDFVFP